MRFDGPTLAHAWLAVMAATGTDKLLPSTYKTIALEEHLHGVRLVATDRRLLLTAYVPDLESHYDSPPGPEEASERTHVLSDRDGRARGLLGHVCRLATELDPEDYTPGDLEVRIDFDQAATGVQGSGPVQPTLDGMEATYATLTVPGRERLNIENVGNSFPDWRRVADHRAKRTLGALLPPEQLEKLARIRKHARGALQVTMGEKTAHVEYPESDPNVAGVLVLADPEDPQVYQEPDDQLADPDQITIDEAIDAAEAGDLTVLEQLVDQDTTTQAAQLRAVDVPDLLEQAAVLTVSTQLGSAAQLQRTLRIGQARAAKLMDTLEEIGVVGPADAQSGKSRPVLIKGDQLDQARAAARGHQA